jgi:hypothetical protein
MSAKPCQCCKTVGPISCAASMRVFDNQHIAEKRNRISEQISLFTGAASMRSWAFELPDAGLGAASAAMLAGGAAVGAASDPVADLAACSGQGPKPRAAILRCVTCRGKFSGQKPCHTCG